MTFYRTPLAFPMSATCSVSDLFSTTSKQALVQDEAVFAAPNIDPYSAVNEANRRIKAGLSLFDTSSRQKQEEASIEE
jgi:hypothetical protein